MTPLPPTRYRIEERGRRLVVIDQWAGNVEVTANLPSQPGAPSSRSDPGASGKPPTTMARAAAAAARSSGPDVRSGQASANVAPAGNALTRALFKLQPTGHGAAILTTTKLYDLAGPRQVALSRPQLAKLNSLVIVLVIALGLIILFGLAGNWILLFILAFILFRFQGSLRQRTTAAIDRLA